MDILSLLQAVFLRDAVGSGWLQAYESFRLKIRMSARFNFSLKIREGVARNF